MNTATAPAPVIDYDSPIEVRNGRRVYSELTDYGYELADKIELWIETRHGKLFTPSRIAQGIKCDTHEAAAVLEWLDARQMSVTGDGNGAWRKYAAR